MIKKQLSLANKLAPYYSKKYGEILYSGTLAIETVLYVSNIKKGDTIIIQEDVCYRILLAIIRLGAKAIIVTPKNGFTLIPEEIAEIVKKYSPKILILIHNLGLPVNIKSFKQKYGRKLTILEDASLTWNLKYKGFSVGMYSDYVITSFGKSKPLSFGFGGAIFSNSNDFKRYLDYNDSDSRISENLYLPYVLPKNINIDLNKAISNADKLVLKAQKIADLLTQGLKIPNVTVWEPSYGDVATWHRFPIIVHSKHLFKKILNYADEFKICYELPHKLKLSEIPLAIRYNCVCIKDQALNKYRINIYIKNNNISNLKLWLKKIKNIKN